MMDGTGIAQLFAQPAKAAPSLRPSERERRGGNNPIQNLALKGSLPRRRTDRVLLSALENGKDEFGPLRGERVKMIRLRCSFPPLRKNKRHRKRNFHPSRTDVMRDFRSLVRIISRRLRCGVIALDYPIPFSIFAFPFPPLPSSASSAKS